MSDELRLDALSIALRNGWVSVRSVREELKIESERARQLVRFLAVNGVVSPQPDEQGVYTLRPRG